METFGDPGWFHHQQIAQLWGLTALRLANSPIVDFSATAYTDKLTGYVRSLSSSVLESVGGDEAAKLRVDLEGLKTSVKRLAEYAKTLDSKANDLRRNPKCQRCYLGFFCIYRSRVIEINRVNKAYLKFERSFIGKGLPGRPIYKHVIYAPGTWEGYAGLTLPSIREAIADERWAEAKEQVQEVTYLFEKAASQEVL
jgi:N-acetylated-alpha-linked acidic dipeptidase